MEVDRVLFQEMVDAGQARLREVLDAPDISPEEREVLFERNRERVTDGISDFFRKFRGFDPGFPTFLEELAGEDTLREQLADMRLAQANRGKLPAPPERYQSHSRPLDGRKGGVVTCGGSIGAYAMG